MLVTSTEIQKQGVNVLIEQINYDLVNGNGVVLRDITAGAYDYINSAVKAYNGNKTRQSVNEKSNLSFYKVPNSLNVYKVTKDRYDTHKGIEFVSKEVVDEALRQCKNVSVFDGNTLIASNFILE